MKIKLKILLTILLFPSLLLLSQQSRLDALGGLSYSIVDIDSQIDPYIMGENPAWMVNSYTNQRLEINPLYKNSSGDYHRLFESGNITNVDVSFLGIKPLGSSGTFRGYAAYNYEKQKDRYRVLTLTPYAGDAFFFTDSTSGDYRYSGPTFEFMHSLEVIDNLFIGASVNYKILDGLKKVYTFAETLYRDVSGNIGVAYKISNDFSIGINYQIFDTQEKILADDVNKRNVQTFLYRGDTHRIVLNGGSQDFKIKRFGNIFGFQTQFIPIKNLTVGFDVKCQVSNSSSLFRVTSIIDTEDGYTSFDKTNINLQARWLLNNIVNIGFKAGYNDNNSWSKNSKHNLTLWELGVNDVFTGVGFTITAPSKDLLIGFELEIHNIKSDSLKYIDNKFTSLSALNIVERFGVEKSFSKMFTGRIGYNILFKEHDFIYGGKNVIIHYVTLGGKIKVSDSIEIEPRLEYATTSSGSNNLHKNNFGIYTTLRFYNF